MGRRGEATRSAFKQLNTFCKAHRFGEFAQSFASNTYPVPPIFFHHQRPQGYRKLSLNAIAQHSFLCYFLSHHKAGSRVWKTIIGLSGAPQEGDMWRANTNIGGAKHTTHIITTGETMAARPIHLDCEPFATFGASSRNDSATKPSAHTSTEAMSALAREVARLVGTFHNLPRVLKVHTISANSKQKSTFFQVVSLI